VTLTVVASIRHQNTDYDELQKAGVPCAVAREQVRPTVDMARSSPTTSRACAEPSAPIPPTYRRRAR
jgi:hypothetical protein